MKDSQRRWRDGSLEEDLPMRSLSEMFNVNYFLVSQTNPHIVPALNLKKRVNRKLGNILEAEWKHRHAFSPLSVPLLSEPWKHSAMGATPCSAWVWHGLVMIWGGVLAILPPLRSTIPVSFVHSSLWCYILYSSSQLELVKATGVYGL